MANSRIMLVCKHCGENFCIGKGYFGSYSTSNDELHKQLNIFYGEHEHGCCSEDIDCSDNARNHFAILEEGEDLGVLAADVVPKSEYDAVVSAVDNSTKEFLKLHDDYQEAKSEVASILDEIEKTIRAALILIDFGYKHNQKEMQCKKECYEDFLGYIAELKKKYTEEQE